MIRSWRNKGLQELFATGSWRRLSLQGKRDRDYILKLLDALNRVKRPGEMTAYGFKYHATPHYGRQHSVWVSGNWRITFNWAGGPTDVELEDYH